MATDDTNLQMIKPGDVLPAESEMSPDTTRVCDRSGNHLEDFAYYTSDFVLFIERPKKAASAPTAIQVATPSFQAYAAHIVLPVH